MPARSKRCRWSHLIEYSTVSAPFERDDLSLPTYTAGRECPLFLSGFLRLDELRTTAFRIKIIYVRYLQWPSCAGYFRRCLALVLFSFQKTHLFISLFNMKIASLLLACSDAANVCYSKLFSEYRWARAGPKWPEGLVRRFLKVLEKFCKWETNCGLAWKVGIKIDLGIGSSVAQPGFCPGAVWDIKQ